jgi:hypothetical protein
MGRIVRRPLEKLRVIPPFEFENWAVIAYGQIIHPAHFSCGFFGLFFRFV